MIMNEMHIVVAPITFTEAEVIAAIEQWLRFGEGSCVELGQAFNSGHRGYYSQDGWAARVLKFHLSQLKAEMEGKQNES
jgi:hypothetical protein